MGTIHRVGYFEKLKAFSFVFLFRLIIKSLKMSAFDMGAAKAPSALIKTTRWSLLLVGIWYGHKRYNELKIQEDEIRAYNAKMKPIWDAEKAEKAAKANRENMLSLAKEVGVKIPSKDHEAIHTDILKEKYRSKEDILKELYRPKEDLIKDNCGFCEK